MRYLLIALLLIGCRVQVSTEAKAADKHRVVQKSQDIPKSEQRHLIDVCTDKLEASITSIGACDNNGLCGVLMSGALGTFHCVRKYPVVGQKMVFCRKVEEKTMDGYEYERFLQSGEADTTYYECRQDN